MKRLTAFLAAITLIGSVANIYTSTANALNTISFKELGEQSKEEDAEMPDLEAAHKKVTEGDFTFNVYSDFAFLTDFSNLEAEEVEIPAEIDGIPVVGVDGKPFGNCRNLKSITLPDSMQYFDWFDLVCVVTRVSSGSSGSHTISINTQLTEIDEETTFNPSNVTIMADEEDVIYPTIETVKVSETNPYFTVSDGILYTKDMTKLIGCPPAMDLTELKISEKAEIINDYAFVSCYKLKDLVIPENIKQINNAAFVACINLESIELPKSINAVYMDTFYLCESLKTVKFNGDISAIGIGAFAECSSLTEFDIPDTVTYIGANAFADSACAENVDGIFYVDDWAVDNDEKSKLEKVIFRDGTIGVAEMTFALQSAELRYVDFPESIIHVGDMAVAGSGDYPNEIHYRAPYLNERTLGASKGTSDFYIYNKNCDIFDSEKTIPAEYRAYKLENLPSITDDTSDESIDKSVVIHGYAGSTAQAYAEKYNRKFEVIEEEIPQTTTATTTATVDTTTTTTASSTTTTTATTVETTTVTTEKTTEDIVPEIVKGDANGDGKMTIADAVSLSNWIMGVSDAKLENSEAADLCKDGKIDVFDLCLLREELVK